MRKTAAACANKGDREVFINGEQFYELWPTIGGVKTFNGYSIVCPFHEGCKRDLSWGKRDPMSVPEARARLLRWRDEGIDITEGTEDEQREQHKALGGFLLRN